MQRALPGLCERGLMVRANVTDWRTIWRVVAAIGLAVGAWLLLIPTASIEGTSCGVPLFHTDPEEAASFAADCVDRNGVRVTQAAWTIAAACGWLLASAIRPWLAEVDASPVDDPAAGRLKQATRALRATSDASSAPTTRDGSQAEEP